MAPPIFVKFRYLFLISTHFENLIHLALTVQSFKIAKDLIKGTPNLALPISDGH